MIIALAIAASINTCEWSAPRGLSPLMTPFDEVIEQFTDIPSDVRKALIADVRANRFTDQVTIRKSGITGKGGSEYANLRQMNFSNGKRCNIVTMKTWTALDMETALIYSAKGKDGTLYSLLRPEVCKNWSMITQTKEPTPPPRRLPPPATVSIDPPPAEVDPLPVFAVAPIPPVFVPGVPEEPTTFSAEGSPPPVPRDAYPEPVSVSQEFFDPWSRPIFGPVNRLFVTADLPIQAPLVPLPPMQTPQTPMLPMPPVPGVVPPAPVDLPDRPGDAVAPVPELSTWALMLLGLGCVMWWRRRV